MSRNLWLLVTILILVSACTPATQSTPIIDNATSTPSPIPTATQTLHPTETPTASTPALAPGASVAPLPTIPTFTPTFDVSTILTVTPAPKAECPKENPSLLFDTQNLWGSDHKQFTDYLVDFLNKGGSTRSSRTHYEYPNEIIQKEDVTANEVDEVIFADGIWIDIFGCVDGKFQLLATFTTQGAQSSKIIDVIDLNLDGLAEIVAYFDACMGSRCPSVDVYGWDGSKFKSLIANYSGCRRTISAPLDVEIKDLDKNGTKEIILSNNGEPWPDGLGFSYRKDILICMWNGQNFDLFKAEFGKPYYRYQASQDGDSLVLMGDYINALALYQQTIFSDKLEWFTQERGINDFWVYHSNYFQGEPTPTVSPSLKPDPSEYPHLATYAYYRILLLHLVQGNESDASTVYNTLQEKFGNDQYGRPYVEMATAFWNAYQSAHKMYDGCAAAIQYAAERPDILIPLGSDYHGTQSHNYKPEDVCPFR